LIRQLQESLPTIATDLVTRYQDMSDPANRSFAAAPDDPAEHSPEWHQYGILTHSAIFAGALREQIPEYTRQWDVAVEVSLAAEIDGMTKGQLLQIAALVHDVGKFTARTVSRSPDGSVTKNFTGHERHSGRIVRNDLAPMLRQWGLGEAQLEYVATCAELHFELGKVRRTAKAAGGYTIAFTETPAFIAAAQQIIDAFPDYALEIGLQFVADSLSKTEVAATAETDAGIAAERRSLEEEIVARGLQPKLIGQALQQPVNLAVARRYLQLLA
jgi:hypothetical protein